MIPAALKAVWASVPDVACKGLCVDSCGPIGASAVEHQLLHDRGISIDDPFDALLAAAAGIEVKSCPALVDGRCSVYDVRPTVCRLWGAVEEMPCPHGCLPARGGRLMVGEGMVLLARADEVPVGWRCECGDLNRWHESFCYRCGAGQPED